MLRQTNELLSQIRQSQTQSKYPFYNAALTRPDTDISTDLLEAFITTHKPHTGVLCPHFKDVLVGLLELLQNPSRVGEELQWKVIAALEHCFSMAEFEELVAAQRDVLEGLIRALSKQTEIAGLRLMSRFDLCVAERGAVASEAFRQSIAAVYFPFLQRLLTAFHDLARGSRALPRQLTGATTAAELPLIDALSAQFELLGFVRDWGRWQPQAIVALGVHTRYLRLLQDVDLQKVLKELAPPRHAELFTLLLDGFDFVAEALTRGEAEWRSTAEAMLGELDGVLAAAVRLLRALPVALPRAKVGCFELFAKLFRARPELSLRDTAVVRALFEDDFFRNGSKMWFSLADIAELQGHWISIQRIVLKELRTGRGDCRLPFLLDFAANMFDCLADETLPSDLLNGQLRTLHELLEIVSALHSRLPPEPSTRKLFKRSLEHFLESLTTHFEVLARDLRRALAFFKTRPPNVADGLARLLRACEDGAALADGIEGEFNNSADPAPGHADPLVLGGCDLRRLREGDQLAFLEEAFVERIDGIGKVYPLILYELHALRAQKDPTRNAEFCLKQSVYDRYRRIFRSYLKVAVALVSEPPRQPTDGEKGAFELFDKLVQRVFFRTNLRPGRGARRDDQNDCLSLCYRQCFQLVEENVDEILFVLLICLRRNYTDSMYLFINAFQGFTWEELQAVRDLGVTASHPGRVSRWVYFHRCLFKQIIHRVIRVLHGKDSDALIAVRPFFPPNTDLGLECVFMLKQMFRSFLDMREGVRKITSARILAIRKSVFKLVLVLFEQSLASKAPIDHLYLLLILFQFFGEYESVRIGRSFTDFFLANRVKAHNFFLALFASNVDELRIFGVELLLSFPGDVLRIAGEAPRAPVAQRYFAADLNAAQRQFLEMIVVSLGMRSLSSLPHRLVQGGSVLPKTIAVRGLELLERLLGTVGRERARELLSEKADSLFTAFQLNFNFGIGNAHCSATSAPNVRSEEEIVSALQTFLRTCGSHSELFADARVLFRHSALSRLRTLGERFRLLIGDNAAIDLCELLCELALELKSAKTPYFEHLYRISTSFAPLMAKESREELRALGDFLLSLAADVAAVAETAPKAYETLSQCALRARFLVAVLEPTAEPRLRAAVDALGAAALRPLLATFELALGLCSERPGDEPSDASAERQIAATGFAYVVPRVFEEMCAAIDALLVDEQSAETFCEWLVETLSEGELRRVNALVVYVNERLPRVLGECEALRASLGRNAVAIAKALCHALAAFDHTFTLQFYEDAQRAARALTAELLRFGDAAALGAFLGDAAAVNDAAFFLFLFAERASLPFAFPRALPAALAAHAAELAAARREPGLEANWNGRAVQFARCFLAKARCLLELEPDAETLAGALRAVWALLLEVETFDKLRDNCGRVVVVSEERGEGDAPRYCANRQLYFHDYELRIFPDGYDPHLRGLAAVVEDAVDFLSRLFRPGGCAARLGDLEESRKTSIGSLTRLCFRLENRFFKAFLKGFRDIYTTREAQSDRELQLTFRDYRFLEEANINLPNLYVISKMYTCFNQNVIYQTYFELTAKLFDAACAHFAAAQPGAPRGDEARALDAQYFRQLRFFFKPIQTTGVRILQAMRLRIAAFLEKALNLELVFRRNADWRFSIRRELLFYLNKHANTQLFDHIKENCNAIEGARYRDAKPRFALLRELVAHSASVCIRERISREMIEENVNSGDGARPTRWLWLLHEVTRRSTYYMQTSRNFQSFFGEHRALGGDVRARGEGAFLDERKVYALLLESYMRQNPADYTQMKAFLSLFLARREYAPRRIAAALCQPFEGSAQRKAFLVAVYEALFELLSEPRPPPAADCQTFFLAHLAAAQLSALDTAAGRQELCLVLRKAREQLFENARARPEHFRVVLGFLKRAFETVTFEMENREQNTLVAAYVAHFSAVRFAGAESAATRQLLQLLLALLLSRYPQHFDAEARAALQQLLHRGDEPADEESARTAQECFRMALPALGAGALALFREKFAGAARTRYALQQTSLIRRKWRVAVALKNHFGFALAELFARYFHIAPLSSNERFDVLLAVVSVLLECDAREFVAANGEALLDAVADTFRAAERRTRNTEKCFSLLKAVLALLGARADVVRLIWRLTAPPREGEEQPSAAAAHHAFTFELLARHLPRCASPALCDRVIEYWRWLAATRLQVDAARVHSLMEHTRVVLETLFANATRLDELVQTALSCARRFNDYTVDYFSNQFWLLVVGFALDNLGRLDGGELRFQFPAVGLNAYKRFLYKRLYNSEIRFKEESERARKRGAAVVELPRLFSARAALGSPLAAYRFLMIAYLRLTALSAAAGDDVEFAEFVEFVEILFSKELAFKTRAFVLQCDLLELLAAMLLPDEPSPNAEFASLRVKLDDARFERLARVLLGLESVLRLKSDCLAAEFVPRLLGVLLRCFGRNRSETFLSTAANLFVSHCATSDAELLGRVLTAAPRAPFERALFCARRGDERAAALSVADKLAFLFAAERLGDGAAIEFGERSLVARTETFQKFLRFLSLQKRGSALAREIAAVYLRTRVADTREFHFQLLDALSNDNSLEESELPALAALCVEVWPQLARSEIVFAVAVAPPRGRQLTQPATAQPALIEPLLAATASCPLRGCSLAAFLAMAPASPSPALFRAKALLELRAFGEVLPEARALFEGEKADFVPDFDNELLKSQLAAAWQASQAVLTEWSQLDEAEVATELRLFGNENSEFEGLIARFLGDLASTDRQMLRKRTYRDLFIYGYGLEMRGAIGFLAQDGSALVEKSVRLLDLLETAELMSTEHEPSRIDSIEKICIAVFEPSKRRVSPKLGLPRMARVLNLKSLLNNILCRRDIRPRLAANIESVWPKFLVEGFNFAKMARAERLWEAPRLALFKRRTADSHAFVQVENVLCLCKELLFLGETPRAERVFERLVDELQQRGGTDLSVAAAAARAKFGATRVAAAFAREGVQSAVDIGAALLAQPGAQLPYKLYAALFEALAQGVLALPAAEPVAVGQMVELLAKALEFERPRSHRAQLLKLVAALRRVSDAPEELTKRLESLFVAKENWGFVRENIAEICLFFDERLFADALLRRPLKQLRAIYYQLHNIRAAFDLPHLSSLERALAERLGDSPAFLSPSALAAFAAALFAEPRVRARALVRRIVEEIYRSGVIDGGLCEELIALEPKLGAFMNALRQSAAPKREKLQELLRRFAEWDRTGDERRTPPLLAGGRRLVVPVGRKCLLNAQQRYSMEEVRLLPTVEVRALPNEVVIELKAVLASGKTLPIRIWEGSLDAGVPAANARLSILRALLFEAFVQNPATFRIPPSPSPALLWLGEGRVAAVGLGADSLLEVLQNGASEPDAVHAALLHIGSPAVVARRMMSVVSPELLRRHILARHTTPELFFFMKQSLARGIAYSAFEQLLFGFEAEFPTYTLDFTRGRFEPRVVESLNWRSPRELSLRLSPNFQRVIDPITAENNVLMPLVRLARALNAPKAWNLLSAIALVAEADERAFAETARAALAHLEPSALFTRYTELCERFEESAPRLIERAWF